jgi:acyl-coenzyme A synthetase/AMP-(fatty) acid ligase
MSAVVGTGTVEATYERAEALRSTLPLLSAADLSRTLIWHEGRPVSAAEFLREVLALAEQLPKLHYAVNLCDSRYRFLVAFCAVVVAGQTNLLPSSRAPQAIDEVMHAYAGSYAISDRALDPAPPRLFVLPQADEAGDQRRTGFDLTIPQIAAEHIVAIGFTSGSTGAPKANRKSWASVCASSARNRDALANAAIAPNILATVPAQHMYGLEMSVLLPLFSHAAIHAGHPLFPADVAAALGQMPAPRVLVTTPFHLRALLDDRAALPELAAIVTATAPLDAALAARAEQQYATQVIEFFGSTETCVIGSRRTAVADAWSLYDGIELHPQPDGTQVSAPYFGEPTLLQDIVELLPDRQFVVRGRNGDLLEIAGKRASLSDLTRRLTAICGVTDGVVFQLDAEPGETSVRRLAALAVAPDLSEAEILAALREAVDPVFLPRPLRRVEALPRNATGKLPREELLAALAAKDR